MKKKSRKKPLSISRLLPRPDDDLEAQDRVAPQAEEVVVDADPVEPQDAAPDARERLLHRVARRRHRRLLPGRLEPRERPPVHLAVGRERQGIHQHEGRGHHVVRQPPGEERPQPPPTPREIPDVPLEHRVYVPIIDEPRFIPDVPSDTAPLNVTHERQELPPITETLPVRPAPVEVMPQIDQRRGLSEPEYPPSMIRSGAEGTVILSVQVLENGRVGDVRVERSSGFPKLDESAIREARRWRLIPGTRDGVPVVLWKQIPITFRLQGER